MPEDGNMRREDKNVVPGVALQMGTWRWDGHTVPGDGNTVLEKGTRGRGRFPASPP